MFMSMADTDSVQAPLQTLEPTQCCMQTLTVTVKLKLLEILEQYQERIANESSPSFRETEMSNHGGGRGRGGARGRGRGGSSGASGSGQQPPPPDEQKLEKQPMEQKTKARKQSPRGSSSVEDPKMPPSQKESSE